MRRVILHVDMNSCYASIELLHRPQLRGRPMAVGGDPESRHGIVLAKDQLAKKAGVKTGMALWEARRLCPEIVFVPPNLELYMRFSKMAHAIYGEYTEQQEAFGIDESWLDVTASSGCCGSSNDIAQDISRRIKKELGVTVSIGVSWNKIFAKFGSDYRKPDAITQITPSNYRTIIWPQPVGNLLYVGRATERKLYEHGILTIGQLAQTDSAFLGGLLGKMGVILHMFANGEDQTPVSRESFQAPIKSVGNGITAPRDLVSDQDVKIIVEMLSESVSKRMRASQLKCTVVEFFALSSDMEYSYGRQHKIKRPTNISSEIAREALDLYYAGWYGQRPIRHIGVRASGLVDALCPEQMDLCVNEVRRRKLDQMDVTMESIRSRFGYGSVRKGMMLTDTDLSGRAEVKDHEVHPHGYFEAGNRTGVEKYAV